MLLLAALAFALLIICVSFDAFKGRTALAGWHVSRMHSPVQFAAVLAFYLLGAVLILVAGMASVVPECVEQPDGTCGVKAVLVEASA